MQGLTDQADDTRLLEALAGLERQGLSHLPEQWVHLERQHGPGFPVRLIYLLTRLQFDSAEARRHWQAILAHATRMTCALGRPVGVRTALTDYFTHVVPKLQHPVLIEADELRHQEQTALRDELTGLYNRRFFQGVLAKHVAEGLRYGQQFSLLMMDVDRFKNYNDLFGHPAGDRALYELAQVLQAKARDVDYLVRYGGEEFAAILPRSGHEQAVIAAERLRAAVERHQFAGQEHLPGGNLTLSVGAATFPRDARSAADLLHRADMALYATKRAGRNLVTSSSPERRQHPRVGFNAMAEFRYAEDGDAAFRQGQVSDISLGGLGLTTHWPVSRQRPLRIRIHASGPMTLLEVTGRTVGVYHDGSANDAYHLGIQLEDPAAAQPFTELVRRQMPNTVH